MNQSDDLLLADLLGEAPRTTDPGFRFDVLGLVAERARRRHAMSRALNQIALFSAVGLIFPVFAALGVTWEAAQPMALAVGAVGLALIIATVTIQGPGAVLARSRALLTRV